MHDDHTPAEQPTSHVAGSARYRISEDDYLDAFRTHHRMTRRGWIVLAVALLVEAAIIVLVEDARVVVAAALAGGAAFVLAMRLFIAPWLHRRHYRSYRLIQQEQALELREAGLYFTRENAASLLAWGDILKWRRGPDMLLLYIGPRLFHMVPVSVAAQGFPLPALEQALRRHVGEPA